MTMTPKTNPNAIASIRWQRRLALVVVVTPLLGVVAAGALLWGYGFGLIELTLLAVLYVATVVGVEVGMHRHFSHRAFQAHPAVRAMLAILGSTAAQGPVLFWAAVHRSHHAHSDREGDPHSPYEHGEGYGKMFKGLWHAHVGWLFRPGSIDFGAVVPDLLRDRMVFRLHCLYPLWVFLGLAVPAAIGGIMAGSWRGCLLGFVWGGLVRIFLVHHATWSVNSLCHVFGSRPFETNDRSTNNAWLLPSSLGGCWHNNHHAFPTAAKNNFRWWQIDPCGWFISVLEITGLAWDVKMPKREARAARRNAGDCVGKEVAT